MPAVSLDQDYWRKLTEIIAVGLNSGTSMDGVDVAVVRFRVAEQPQFEILHFATIPYPPSLRAELQALLAATEDSGRRLARAHWAAGQVFADAALVAIHACGLSVDQIHCIGSHGQTMFHFPDHPSLDGLPVRGTLQIGEAAVISARTGVVTVADFRANDVASGGQGAPLIPYFDYCFFRHPNRARFLLNIGGIANFTYLPANCQPAEVRATDTGPGNMVIDQLCRRFFQQRCDFGGSIAARGRVNSKLLQFLLNQEYFQRCGPKSAGYENFGAGFLDALCREAAAMRLDPVDMLATATAFTAESVAAAIRQTDRELLNAEVLVSGGGCHNATLFHGLQSKLAPARLKTIEELGMPVDAKEAVCFAYLSYLALKGEPANLPGVTGARRCCICGKICLP